MSEEDKSYNSTLFTYQFKPDTWGTIQMLTCYYALAVHRDHLVLAGGRLLSHLTPTILTCCDA